ncbi:MAG: hypothetical protein O9328_19705 [Rhodobacteraceae bacterium]|nr:hypothetical protein [Paracoccaceae bacterium]
MQRAKEGSGLRVTHLAADPVPLSEFDESFLACLDRVASGRE